MNEIVLLPYRIVPCDFGNQINEGIFSKIIQYLKNIPGVKILEKAHDIRETLLLSVKIHHSDASGALFLQIYSDGIGIFTIIDKEEKYGSVNDFSPDTILNLRKKAHKELLTHSHAFSEIIQKHVSEIRNFFDREKRRFTSFSTWEKRGLSYVMSFYFIDCDVKLVRDDIDFQEKLTFLLFPCYGEYESYHLNEINVQSDFVKKQFRENFIEVVKRNYDLLPNIHTCASWSNFIIIGEITNKIIDEYWKLEKDLQHVWFYSYITDKFIEDSLKNISSKTPEENLELLNSILTEMIFKINQYEGIISSTMHERDFKLYHALKTSSRLDVLISSLDKKAQLLKDRFNWLLAEKRNRTDKRIEVILFIIATISVVGSWQSFRDLGWYIVGTIIFLIAVFAYFFYRPYFFKKRK